MVGVEHGTFETARRTSNGRKFGGCNVYDARKARTEGPSRNLGGFWGTEGAKGLWA